MFKIIRNCLIGFTLCIGAVLMIDLPARVTAQNSQPYNGAQRITEEAPARPVELVSNSMDIIPQDVPVLKIGETAAICGQYLSVLDYRILRNEAGLKTVDIESGQITKTATFEKRITIDANTKEATLLPGSDLVMVKIGPASGALDLGKLTPFLFYSHSVDFPVFNQVDNGNGTYWLFFYVPLENPENQEYYAYMRCNPGSVPNNPSNINDVVGRYKNSYATWMLDFSKVEMY